MTKFVNRTNCFIIFGQIWRDRDFLWINSLDGCFRVLARLRNLVTTFDVKNSLAHKHVEASELAFWPLPRLKKIKKIQEERFAPCIWKVIMSMGNFLAQQSILKVFVVRRDLALKYVMWWFFTNLLFLHFSGHIEIQINKSNWKIMQMDAVLHFEQIRWDLVTFKNFHFFVNLSDQSLAGYRPFS